MKDWEVSISKNVRSEWSACMWGAGQSADGMSFKFSSWLEPLHGCNSNV